MVDWKYCAASDFDGFDAFIRRVMPEKVNKPYSKSSVKQISQTVFDRPHKDWKFDPMLMKTRAPYDRMQKIAERFQTILLEHGLRPKDD
ncbi:MAG: hypothetical protein K6C10_05580 [Prevotella sp.]|nr:hypothetical protein [Prevotella sp.]